MQLRDKLTVALRIKRNKFTILNYVVHTVNSCDITG
jgi:hypothetical protein